MLSGLSILVIGSSHLASPGYLVSSLHDNLQNAGAQVHTIGVCGLTPGAWLQSTHGLCGGAERVGKGPLRLSINRSSKTTSITQLVETEKPNLVLIVMGDTLAGYAEPYFPKQWASQEVWKLTSTLEKLNVRCAWVGPAWGTEGGELRKTYERVKLTSDFLASNVKPCIYIDSLKMSKPGEWPSSDGQHYTPVGYKAWGAAIFRAVDDLPK
jgi:hypothetical protein